VIFLSLLYYCLPYLSPLPTPSSFFIVLFLLLSP
jgi:hypothetical protein